MIDVIGQTEERAVAMLKAAGFTGIKTVYCTNDLQGRADTMLVVRAIFSDSDAELVLTPFILKV